MRKEIFIGIFCIVFGIYLITHTYKHLDSQLTSINFKGYAGGLGLIVVGIMFVIGKILL